MTHKHLSGLALVRLHLLENQYAYQIGKSFKQTIAIHELEGAFDKASFLLIERALQTCRVWPVVGSWISSTIRMASQNFFTVKTAMIISSFTVMQHFRVWLN